MLVADQYQLLEEIGEGGMSTVFRALDTLHNKEVALKAIHVPDGDDSLQRRFFSELLLTSGVRHPNIIQIHDFGICDTLGGLPFIVIDLLTGFDLAEVIARQGMMRPHRILRLFSGVLEALSMLHQRGIVHKDIKPANLFLHRMGRWNESLILTDFGIAHQDNNTRATRTGLLACTPQYSAPEYLTYQTVSPAMDVYQMGLVLGEALLGWALVDEPTVVLCVMAHCDGNLRIPRLMLHGPIGDVLQRSLAPDPEDRFPNAGAMLDALLNVDADALELSLDLLRRMAS